MSRNALFERLSAVAQPPAVVTPSRRLARSLARDFDLWQTANGRAVWETPEILPFAAFAAKLYDRAQHDPALTGVRAPLSEAQERAVWERIVADSGVALAAPSAAAELARQAWSLSHQWRCSDDLAAYALSDDTRTFVAWSVAYQPWVERIGATDGARLPELVRTLVLDGRLQPPAHLLLVGFDELTPQQSALINAFKVRGAQCERLDDECGAPGHAVRAACGDTGQEVERMADWVAARLGANAGARIGVVVPDLAARRRSIVRALDAALEPDALLAAPDRMRPFTVSLGSALADTPLVATALGLLRLVAGPVDYRDASAALRSRYLSVGGRQACDRFDAQWRGRSGRMVALDHLQSAAARASLSALDVAPLATVLEQLQQWRARDGRGEQRWSEWATRFGVALRIAGFPGQHSLDSTEYQTLGRWQELVAEFASLERVQARTDLQGAVARIGRLASATVFQPEGGDPPVQVLGLLEANGLKFDHLWLMGLTSESWPAPARAHPLLPIELQRQRQMPGALAALELRRARSTLDRLRRSAPEVVASYAMRDGDRVLGPSPMIAGWPEHAPEPRAGRALDAIAPARLHEVHDAAAPPLLTPEVLGAGAAALANQAACPFRAFALHRLQADTLDDPHDGLDASERGQLIHLLLARFWQSVAPRTRSMLVSLSDAERRTLLERAADEALARVTQRRLGGLGATLRILERRRLVELGLRWLQFESDERSEFEVMACEERRSLAIGPLSLNGRLDRVDRLPDGRSLVIDYKTGGQAGVRSWLGPRPDEPQLPLYLVASQADACAVAFGRVRAGEMRFVSLAEDESVLPEAKTVWREEFRDWSALVAAWRGELTRLAEEFARGVATVDPKRGAQSCRNCHLATLCRHQERAGEHAGQPMVQQVAADE